MESGVKCNEAHQKVMAAHGGSSQLEMGVQLGVCCLPDGAAKQAEHIRQE